MCTSMCMYKHSHIQMQKHAHKNTHPIHTNANITEKRKKYMKKKKVTENRVFNIKSQD